MPVVEERYKDSVEYFKVYSDLISAARNKTTLNYKDVARIMGLPETGQNMGTETGHLLGEISENEHNNNIKRRPMLSALVIKSGGNEPGNGFYTLACLLHRLKEGATNEEKKVFWKNERDQVYEKWSD